MSRHASMADQLKTLLEYRSRPEGPIEPTQTNWRTTPANDSAANDNNPEEIADFGFERQILIMPSVQEIARNIEAGPTVRNDAGQIISIGELRFSDGKQTEKAYCVGPEGKVIQFDAKMPVGAMLGTRDKADRQLGGTGAKHSEIAASGRYYAEVLATDYPVYRKGAGRRNGKSYTRDESAAMLAEAYANTPNLPAVTYCPPALPCGSARPDESFVGMRKGKKGESGAIAWEDVASSIASRETWNATLAYLSEKDVKTLDTAIEAPNTYAIGSADGYTGRSAWRHGKRALLAANDNLRKAMGIAA